MNTSRSGSDVQRAKPSTPGSLWCWMPAITPGSSPSPRCHTKHPAQPCAGQVVDQPAVAWIARALYYLLPNLAPFNVRAEVVYGLPVSASHVGFTLLYALIYSSALLVAAVAIFRRRDFK